jgi:DNA adenine methylase
MKPIVKWAGGKSKLLHALMPHVPAKIGTYAEPFAGGAALFFGIAGEDLATGESRAPSRSAKSARRWKRAVLNDQNEELVACYRAVKDDVASLIDALHEYRYDRDLYYEVRDRETRGMSDVERGARFIFLNRTCFNGLWRVNASGKFNVPFGRYKNPRIVDEKRLRAASHALKSVDLRVGDFAKVTRDLGEGDFVYFDPPYVPLSKTAAFTAYDKSGFGEVEQARLAKELRRLKEAGVRAVLSNADTPETRELYAGLRVSIVQVTRPINSDPSKRGDTAEVVVTTWGEPGFYVGGVKQRRSA